MRNTGKAEKYFPYEIQITRDAWEKLKLDAAAMQMRARKEIPQILFYRHLANSLNRQPDRRDQPVKAGNVNLYALLTRIFRYLLDRYTVNDNPEIIEEIIEKEGLEFNSGNLFATLKGFVEYFPGTKEIEKTGTAADYLAAEDPGNHAGKMLVREILLLRLTCENPALEEFRELFDDTGLAAITPYAKIVAIMDERLAEGPPYEPFEYPVMEFLRLPMKFSPSSLAGQLEYIRVNWAQLLPHELLSQMLLAFDILREEEREWWGGPGKPQVLEFDKGARSGSNRFDYPEYERFSPDADWMTNVVMIAKMVYVWMDQLSRQYGREISRLDQIPDQELDRLAGWGFNCIWLIGVWERSAASGRIKQLCGNPEAVSSAYSLYDYTIASDLGGETALENLKERAKQRGIRLASDMVPNHTGIYSRWTREHPDWFVQLDFPPYPAYSFNGPDLSFSSDISLYIEDGYWDRRDAAVVFKHVDNNSGRTRYIYHGNDGTSTPWNDTAQLNYLIPEVRETVIRTIIHVARQFPVIRFDAAMTLAKKHFQRLWYPQPGHGSGVPSRAEHGMSREQFDKVFPHEFWREVVDRMAVEAPDTLLLAEAFWLMEGYFVRTLGMHRVYNSAFMNMLKMEENAKYRQTIKNILEFNPEILKRFVNFMSNPDERTAIDQFGKEGKYFGAAVLLVTMPGLPMFGHGQIEGFTEKYGMEYRRAYWKEEIDRHLVATHESRIFPLMKKRWLFSGSENFALYDFFAGDRIDENVFAYSNRVGNEKAIIFYNNKFASTAGRISLSAAGAVKDGQDGTVPVQKTLGEALGFNPDGRIYYAFRDYSSGLEYLRHGRELAEKGMYVELEAYDYHVFLDFREIRDDDFGTWGALCHKLQGRPVEDLEEEVKQIRYMATITPLAEFCAGLAERADLLFDADAPAEERKANKEFLKNGITAFLAALGERTGHPENVGNVADRIIREFEFAGTLTRISGAGEAESRAVRFVQSQLRGQEFRFNRLFLALYLSLHRIGEIAGRDGFASRSAAWLDEYGFIRTLQETVHVFLRAGTQSASPWDTATEILLLEIMLAHQSLFSGLHVTEQFNRLQELFDDEKTRQFLLVHRSGETEWFNRERYEDLLHRLMPAEIISTGPDCADEKSVRKSIVLGYEKVQEYIQLAEAAGYRTDLFRSLLQPGA